MFIFILFIIFDRVTIINEKYYTTAIMYAKLNLYFAYISLIFSLFSTFFLCNITFI